MLRYTIHLDVLFIYICAGVKCGFYIKCSIYNVLIIFFISMTKHLAKYHKGGKTDCDSWILWPQPMIAGKTGSTGW